MENGPLYGARAVAYQFVDHAKKNKDDTAWPMLAVGVITVAIGAVMAYNSGMKLWEQRVKEQAKAAKAGKGR